MPGIAGIFTRDAARAPKMRDAMVHAMVHEKFYTSGGVDFESLGTWLGWTNHEGAFADCLPIWNEAKDICAIFVGEDFRDQEELDQLRGRGHNFDPNTASYLVHLYEEHGQAFFERLNGMFSGVVVDCRQQTVMLFNDRFGLGRIYIHETGDGLFFSSEAKSLLKVLPATRVLDSRSVGEYLSCGAVLQNRTLFSGISLMPPGSVWTFGQGTRKERYFDPAILEQQGPLTESEYYEAVKGAWKRLLPRYFRGRQRMGLSLTGGIDSRLVLAWANAAPGTLPCYTFGGTRRDCWDVRIGRQLAELCKQSHETISVDRRFLTEFPRLAERAVFLTDGTLDPTGATDLYLHGRVRAIAPARMTGTYGGETMRRLVAFKPTTHLEHALTPEMRNQMAGARETYLQELSGNRLSFSLFKQAPWHIYARLAVDKSQVTFRTPYLDNDLIRLAYRAPIHGNEVADVTSQLIECGNPALAKIPTDRGVVPGRKSGWAHQFQQFTFKAEYAFDYGMPQWLTRADSLLAPLRFERFFLGRHKYYHFRTWYRRDLAGYLKDTLLTPAACARPYLEKGRLQQIVQDHTSGRANYTVELHRILALELVHRSLLSITNN